MLTEETYREMKKLCHMYENNSFPPVGPYIEEYKIEKTQSWNQGYDQNAQCKCGHPYYRHFDSYEDMEPIGCKYCQCDEFEPEPTEMVKTFIEWIDSMSDEELEEKWAKYGSEEENLPRGWIPIEDALPKMRAQDMLSGGTQYKVAYADGHEDYSYVMDHHAWYHHAKEVGITHWLNEKN